MTMFSSPEFSTNVSSNLPTFQVWQEWFGLYNYIASKEQGTNDGLSSSAWPSFASSAPPRIHINNTYHDTSTETYDTGTISGILAMDYWKELFSTSYTDSHGQLDVSPSQSSAIVSILSAGTFFGALCSPFLGGYIGRRWALIIMGL
ncbi:hypothetical protein CEP54_007265 [Fusarium duplospermum]|uniref:Major facilitator superfamily (MFS) profile domain-containing protein n=1 Tax=Fusarium duplospermum TaxID=1325734 RepID=A0A428Q259_9HYPO|nr:hypothetical protein CEP54_007265 [Fusarium duplospermum]